VVVERFATPDKSGGTSVATFQGVSGFTGWTSFKMTQAGTLPFFGDATISGPSTLGISIATPPAAYLVGTEIRINYGQWAISTASSVSYEANKLYRTVYTLSSTPAGGTASVGKIRLINQTPSGQWEGEMEIDPYTYTAQMPSTTGTEYSVWQESIPTLYAAPSDNKMGFLFDDSDGSSAQGGTAVLNKIEVLSYAIP
jgi:hypothetical protein